MIKKVLSLLFFVLLIASCSNTLVDAPQKDDAVQSEGFTAPERQAYHGNAWQTEVLLQGFHWNTWEHGTWNILRDNAQTIANAGFTMVWLPPPSRSTGGTGYLPSQWLNYNSSHGSSWQLQQALNALNNAGVKPISDIVINHRVGTYDWADFSSPAFADNARAVTRDDEWGHGTGNWDTGSNYHAGRDLDHTYWSVQNEIKSWLGQLKSMGFHGWRYDYVHGFDGYYVGDYNDASSPYFSVGELWPDIQGDYYASGSDVNYHRQILMDWINATGAKSTAFDFTTKWQLQLAVDRNEYWRMRDGYGSAIGAIGWWPQMSTTFLDNHDTGWSPGDGGQNHWPFPTSKLAEGYAYILTHPGTPTVYWPHFFDMGWSLRSSIQQLINIRQQQSIRASSSLSIQAADGSKYAAIVNGNTAVKIGYGNWSPGWGWNLAASGTDWAVWTR